MQRDILVYTKPGQRACTTVAKGAIMHGESTNCALGELEIRGAVSGWRTSRGLLDDLATEVDELLSQMGIHLDSKTYSEDLSGEDRIDRPFFPKRIWFSFHADGVREDSPSVSGVVMHIIRFFESHHATIVELSFVSSPSARAPWTSAVQSNA